MAEELYRDGRAQIRAGNLKAALARAEQGCADWRGRPDSPDYWRFRMLRAEALIAIGQGRQALEILKQPVPPGPAFREAAVRRVLNQGAAFLAMADYPRAKALLDEALRLAENSGGAVSPAEIELRRGTVLARLGDVAGAERSYRRARDIAIRDRDLYLEASAVGNLGFNLLQVSRADEAIPYFEQALALGRKAGLQMAVASSMMNLGRSYSLIGDSDKAAPMLSEAARMFSELGATARQHLALGLLCDVYRDREEFSKAEACYSDAVKLTRATGDRFSQALFLENLTQTAIARHDWAAAGRHNREAQELTARIQSRPLQVWALLHRGMIEAGTKQYATAEPTFRKVLDAAAVERGVDWETHHALANLYAGERRWREAGGEFQAAVEALEAARARMQRDEWKLDFRAASVRFYQNYVDFLMDRSRPEEALEVAEASRARVLAQGLGLKQAAWQLTPAARFRDLARRNRAVLVSYWLAPRRSFVWVVAAAGIRSAVLPPDSQLKPLVDEYRAALLRLRDPLETDNPAGRQLSAALLAPLGRLGPVGARVLLVPDGCLHGLNLAALPVGRHYWIEDISLAVAPSLALLEAAAGPLPRQSLLLIGNPAPPPATDYEPLPAAAQEVKSVRARLARFPSAVYTGASACPQAYREAGPARFALIHFAAHATANPQQPLDSAVILSPRNEAFKLYAREVVGLPLRARLVTISACRGAGARLYSGEGLVGFAWAFLQAGAQNVIAGLWDVADSSTAVLMDRLYAGVAAGRAPAGALRAAQLALLRTNGPWRKPYYWAAFQAFSRSQPFAPAMP